MLRKMFLAFSLIWMFLCTGCVTTPAKNGAVAYEAAPKRNPEVTADSGFLALLPFDYASPLAGDDLEFRFKNCSLPKTIARDSGKSLAVAVN